jgi:hypothetical protein
MINRYAGLSHDGKLEKTDTGRFVLYTDHLSALAEKEKEIEGLRMYKEATQGYESAREKEITRLNALLAEAREVYEKWEPKLQDNGLPAQANIAVFDVIFSLWQVIKKIGEGK